MRLLKQKHGTSLCGQCCIAMIVNISLNESISIFGTSGATTSKQMRVALSKFGYKTKKTKRVRKNIPLEKQLPKLALCTIHCLNSLHWIIWHENQFIDPEIGIYKELPDFYRLTSFIEIKGGI